MRPLEETDLEAMYIHTVDPLMWTYFTSDLSIKAELKKWILAGIALGQQKKRLAFAIIDREKDAVIGSSSLGNISVRDQRVEIGWTWIAPSYQGKGFNAEAKRLLLDYCFEGCGCMRVELKTDVLNLPARKAMLKIGLVEEGVLRSHTQMIRDRRRDTIYYSVLRHEWEAMKARNGWA